VLYIRFGFERNGTERGGDLHHRNKPYHPFPYLVSHTIAHLLQKNKNYTYCFIYLYLVLQTSLYYLSNKKTALISQNYAIFLMIPNVPWYYVQQKNNALNKKSTRSPKTMLYSIGCLLFYSYPIVI
jgi:hypothetical protein